MGQMMKLYKLPIVLKRVKSLKIKNSDGLTMALYQAAAQFQLYTNMKPPINIMKNAGRKVYRKK